MERQQCVARVVAARRASPDCMLAPPVDLELDEAQADAHHSSEEELEAFNCREREKRKWSQVKRTSRTSSCSSDEEMTSVSGAAAAAAQSSAGSPALVQFRSSPPAGAHRPGRPSSPQTRSRVTSPRANTETPSASISRCRKRHRGITSLAIQRPCLDFEKMQQEGIRSVTTWRPSAELSLFCW